MAGGGDGGLSLGGGDGGGGKSGGGGGSPDTGGFGGDPMFSGDSNLSGSGGFPGMDSGNAWTGDQAFGGPPDGSSGNTIDPNIGVQQSQAPTRGDTPESIGGSQGGPQQGQGFGGGSPTQQGGQSGGQLGEMIQKAIKQLQGGGQQQQGAESTAAPTNLTPSLDQLAKGQGFGGGSPSQEATNQTQLMATEVPTTSVSPDQQPTGAIPGSQPTAPAPPPPPAVPRAGQGFGGGSPTEEATMPLSGPMSAVQPPAGGQAGPTGPGATSAPQSSAETALPRDPDAPAPDFSPKTGETTPDAATGSPSGGGGGGGQPSGGGGQPAGAPGGQGFNPIRAVVDLLTGNFGDLQRMAQEASGTAAPPGYDPTTGRPYRGGTGRTSQGTPPATAPTTGNDDLNKKPGGPDNPRVDPNDEQGKRRAEWYKTHDRTDPFPEDTFTPQGPTKEGGTLAQEGAGQPVNWQQIAAQPASTHAQNFGQPFNSNLRRERAPLFQYADTHPEFKRQLFRIMGNEQSSHPQGTQGILESMANRVNSEGLNFDAGRATGWFQDNGYYDRGGGGGDARVLEQSYQNVKNGANITNYATDNASNVRTRLSPGGLARREVQTGRFRNQSQYGGEWFQSPGSEGNRARYEQWRNRMNGGQPPQQTPTAPTPAPTLPPRAGMQPNQQVAMNTRPPTTPQNDPDQSPENRPYMGPTRDDDLNNPGAYRPGNPADSPRQIPPGVPRPYGQRGVDQASLASRYGMDWV